MNDQHLRDMLQQADRVTDAPRAIDVSSDHIGRIVRRRRLQRRSLRGSVAGVIAIAIAVFWHTPTDESDPLSASPVAASPAQVLATFEDSAALLASSLRAETIDSTRPRFETVSFELESAETAGLLLMEAERWLSKPDGRERAKQQYHQIIKMFPNSRWSSEAESQLEQLDRTNPALLPARPGDYL